MALRRLLIDGQPVTPTDLQVRAIVATRDNSVVLPGQPPRRRHRCKHVWQWSEDGLIPLGDGTGVVTAVVGGPTTVLRARDLDRSGAVTKVLGGPDAASSRRRAVDRAATCRYTTTASRRLATAVLPHTTATVRHFQLLLDPYGGPHVQYVLAARNRFALSQWFADQGFARRRHRRSRHSRAWQ